LFFDSTSPEHYATLFFGVYDDSSRELKYVNCGHNPPLVVRLDGRVEHLSATATVFGLFENWNCSTGETTIEEGDILVIFSDGVTEASDAAGQEFGEARLIDILKGQAHSSATSILESIVAEVQRFSPGDQNDDLTLVVARGR
jgi:sigma-B regulation protein RsbU (phosphoserine phosphatase)